MKKIGFIDYYIDEWHSANYPRMIRESAYGKDCEVALAWEEAALEGKKHIDEWCAGMGIAKASGIEQVVEECDYLAVLSPNNPERHEDLTDLPLRSGKPVYVDKTFAPSLDAAGRMIAKAKAHGTPMMSSSALRYDSTIQAAVASGRPFQFVSTRGGGLFDNYAIHQIEMLTTLIGTGAKRVMQCGNEQSKLMTVDYGDERRGVINLIPGCPFQFSAYSGEGAPVIANDMPDFFQRFVDAMLMFFQTGESSAPFDQTLEIAAILEAGNAALGRPDTWVAVPGA